MRHPAPRLALTAALALLPAIALAHQPPPRFPRQRPTLEITSWLALGGGALSDPNASQAVFDLRLGGDVTLSMGGRGDARVGPFYEVASSNFASVSAVAGLEFFFGAAPRPLRMFYYNGEGVLAVRLGAGWAWRDGLPGASSAPISSVTVSYGYRAPFSLREYDAEQSDKPDERDAARYMVGARLWVNTTVDLAAPVTWQLTAGVEFEPVGAFRYLFGLY